MDRIEEDWTFEEDKEDESLSELKHTNKFLKGSIIMMTEMLNENNRRNAELEEQIERLKSEIEKELNIRRQLK